MFEEELEKAVSEILNNHLKIIDDWCKAYMAQRFKEGISIDVGSFTLCQQNLSLAPNEVGFKYWFEDGTPDYNNHWISVDERLPEKNQQVLIFSGEIYMSTWMEYEFSDELHWDGQLSYLVTHWMPLPKPPGKDAS